MAKSLLLELMKVNQSEKNGRPIILIHGLWNSSDIFKYFFKKLDGNNIEYYAPTLVHKFGMISIAKITESLNKKIICKFGKERQIDIVGFSMGGIIGRYWIKNFDGYKRTKRFISIGSPHNGTLTAQLIPQYPLKGIAEMKINSRFIKELESKNSILENIECISFYTLWDLMVFPGWRAYLPYGSKISLNILIHKNLVKNPAAVNKIFEKIIK